MRKKLLREAAFALIGVAFMIAATPLWGEEKPLTLPEAVSLALKENGELKALKEERGIYEAAVIKAGTYPNPVFELGVTTGAPTGSSSENSISVGISQEFLTGGKKKKRSGAAQKELVGFDARLSEAERLLRQEVKVAYYGMLLAHSRLELALEADELNASLLQIAMARFGAGDVAELDVNLAKVEEARGEEKKAEAEQELVPAKQRLLLLMGSPLDEEVKLTDSLEARLFIGELDDLKRSALENRDDLKALKAETEKAEVAVLLARADRIPNVVVGLNYTREHSSVSFGGIEDRSRDNLIGLELAIPIPVFDRNRAGLKEGLARKTSVESRYVVARQAVEREVTAAFSRIASSRKAVEIYRAGIIPQLEENLKLVQEAYKLGEVGILTVVEEQKKFVEVNDGYLMALYKWNTALANLEAAVGVELMKNDGGNDDGI